MITNNEGQMQPYSLHQICMALFYNEFLAVLTELIHRILVSALHWQDFNLVQQNLFYFSISTPGAE